MEAPVYPPAERFFAPQRKPARLSALYTPIAVLRANPAAWAILLEAVPGFERRIANPMMAPHLGNFSVASLTVFGVVDPKILAPLDERLAALGEF